MKSSRRSCRIRKFDESKIILMLCELIFFFQAEDGIRDYKVTGVQTCALPISRGPRLLEAEHENLKAELLWGDRPDTVWVNVWCTPARTAPLLVVAAIRYGAFF